MFRCPHCAFISTSHRDHFQHTRRCSPQSNSSTTASILQPNYTFPGTSSIPLPSPTHQTFLENSLDHTNLDDVETAPHLSVTSSSHVSLPNGVDDEGDDSEIEEVNIEPLYDNPDPDNEPNTSGTHLNPFQWIQIYEKNELVVRDFISFLKSRMHSSHDEAEPTTEATLKPNLHQTFQWKSKNYEVLSQLLNTLALSESQAELVLLGVRHKFLN